MSTFKPGDIVFSNDGEQLEYVARVEDGHIVRPLYDDREDGFQTVGTPRVDARVFQTEPMQRFAAETEKAKEACAAASRELAQVQAELHSVKAEREKALSMISKHPNLSVVVDWMEGRLTHLATIESYGMTIKTIKDAITPGEHSEARDGKVRLLALYGGYSGTEKSSYSYQDNLYWQLSAYSDGSGNSHTRCILGTSVEDVKARLQVWLDAELKKPGSHSESMLVGYAESAIKLGLRVPEALSRKVQSMHEQRLQGRIQHAERQLKSAQESVKHYEQEVHQLQSEKGVVTQA